MLPSVFVVELVDNIDFRIDYDYFFAHCHWVRVAQLISTLPGRSGRMSVGSNPILLNLSSNLQKITFQLIAVEFVGLQFTNGRFNPKPCALAGGGLLQ